MQTVTCVELSVFERITPLVSGYLGSYAALDDVVSSEYRFDTYTTSIKTPLDTIACDISKARRDLGYEPVSTLVEGMRASIRWCLQRGAQL